MFFGMYSVTGYILKISFPTRNILYHLDIKLQVSRRNSRSVLEYLKEHGQKLCTPPDGIMNKQLRLWYYVIASLALV